MYIFLLANIIIVTDRLSEIWLMTTLRKSTIMEKTRYERTKQMISILDYDAGNIKSVEKAVQYLTWSWKLWGRYGKDQGVRP